MPLNQQAREGVIVLAGMINPNYQGEIGLLLHNESKEEYSWNTGYSLGYLLVLPCLEIKINGKQ